MSSTTWTLVALVFGELAVTASVVSCLWLANQFWKVSKAGKLRLFRRQLFSFAIACALQNIVFALIVWTDVGGRAGLPSPVSSNVGCNAVFSVFSTLRFIVLLQEMHIALTFPIQALRLVALLRVWNRGIPAVWISGLLLGVAGAVFYPWELRDAFCYPKKRELLSIWFLVLAESVWITSTVATLLLSFWQDVPSSVRRKNFNRAVSYPLVAVVAYTMIVAEYIWVPLLDNQCWNDIANLFEASNGYLVVLVFHLQKRNVIRSGQGTGLAANTDTGFASFHALMGGVDVIEFISEPDTP